MATWKFKSCLRCGGDMFIAEDLDGWYRQCLQCSYRQELRNPTEFKQRPASERKELTRAGGSRSRRR